MPKALDSSPVPLEDRPERGGIALRPHPQPAIEIALRPEILRGDEHAPASPEGAGEHDGPVDPRHDRARRTPGSPEQRQRGPGNPQRDGEPRSDRIHREVSLVRSRAMRAGPTHPPWSYGLEEMSSTVHLV